MTLLFDLIYLLLVCFSPIFLIIRRIKRGKGSLGLAERFGKLPSRPVSGKCIWIHAVSMGETNATVTLVKELRRRCPDAVIAISSTTNTGIARAKQLYPEHMVFRFPLDFSWVIKRVFRNLRPTAIVLMELEVWPNIIAVAQDYDIPIMIANGRVTEGKSMKRFRKPVLRSFAKYMFSRVSWVGAQEQTYADRFIELGVPKERVHIVGTVKYDTADISDRVDGQDELAADMGIDKTKPLWVCGSTGPGEETIILDAYATLRQETPDLQLAIIPRKPERFNEVADLIVKRGFACLRRSTGSPIVPSDADTPAPIFLGDTMGELRKFYSLAQITFVGRSLVPMGGSDMIEAAALAKPVLLGPYTENFEEVVQLLTDARACQIVDTSASLRAAVSELLTNDAKRKAMGKAGRRAVKSKQGATEATVEAILHRVADQ